MELRGRRGRSAHGVGDRQGCPVPLDGQGPVRSPPGALHGRRHGRQSNDGRARLRHGLPTLFFGLRSEDRAKASKVGLWAGSFETPEQFRKTGGYSAKPRSRTASRVASSDWAQRAQANCSIKGNRNRRGEWIYHLPGMPYYDQTRPEEIFCTEAEAQAAGYRRAIVR